MKTTTMKILHGAIRMLLQAEQTARICDALRGSTETGFFPPHMAQGAAITRSIARVNALMQGVATLPEVFQSLGTRRTAEQRDGARRTSTALWAAATEAAYLVAHHTSYKSFPDMVDHKLRNAETINAADYEAASGYQVFSDIQREVAEFASNQAWGDADEYLKNQLLEFGEKWPPSLKAQVELLHAMYSTIRAGANDWNKRQIKRTT